MESIGSVALVTGASSGIGKAIAEQYVREGTAVVLADLDDVLGHQVEQELRDMGGAVKYVRCDVSSPDDNERAVEAAVREFGRLDYAVNNAGIAGAGAPTADYPIDAWQRVIDVNLSGAFYGMRAQIRAMLAGGGGAIVNVSSILGQVGYAGAPAYVAAKHGLVGLTKATALDYAAQGIRVNAVGPGFIETPMIANVTQTDAIKAAIVAQHPIGRLGQAHEVAELVCFLTSSKASFITGSYYAVDGGFLAR
ncbi:MAG: SDR family oxidoreductase [Candidatus Kapabacteria bacterium]|nr:SDR family oxidoreductase [Candidatus Kapabacteria bacterium]